jgi:hypothetical protein
VENLSDLLFASPAHCQSGQTTLRPLVGVERKQEKEIKLITGTKLTPGSVRGRVMSLAEG